MAVKKSELYSMLWEACNKLRGGVEPARYKDYVLVLLFHKYVSDRFKGEPFAIYNITDETSFDALVKVKGKPDIGERVDKIIQKFMEDNHLQGSLPEVSFNNTDELGSGKELVDKVSGLIGVFQNPAIDFRANRASGDDIIGDAYEYFMMKFAQESGKSKGQFYTPSEVSRIIARLIGIGSIKPRPDKSWTLYDPAAGSGSLLIRAADEAPRDGYGDPLVTICGQEKDHSTAGLANMNLVLHQKGTGRVERGNTLVDPFFKDGFGQLRTFDFIVMNPPFSDKSWSDGLKASDDPYHRFEGFGVPPEKNGDFAWFLHVVKSLDSRGKAGIVMPHGVLFRGNAEETIRKEILKRRYIKGIVSLPANLFYGTSIPACLVFLDKEDAERREGIFFIDASGGCKKDGNKNRLREQDIEKIVRVYTAQEEIKGYSRLVPYDEITDENTNDGNMNVPRYIQKPDDALPQNIAAHLRGGIPGHDIDTLDRLWAVSPALKDAIFTCTDPARGIYQLAIASDAIESAFEKDEALQAEKQKEGTAVFEAWRGSVRELLLGITKETDPRTFIRRLGGMILEAYKDSLLLDNYDVYDCLMNYWNEKLQDDVYAIKACGYEAAREIEYTYAQKKAKDESGETILVDDKSKVKSFDGALIPRAILEREYFAEELAALRELTGRREQAASEMEEMREEESGEEGLLREVLTESGDLPKGNLAKRLKFLESKRTSPELAALLEIAELLDAGKTTAAEKAVREAPAVEKYGIRSRNGTTAKAKMKAALKAASADAALPEAYREEYDALLAYQGKLDEYDALGREIKAAQKALDGLVLAKYEVLTKEEIQHLLFDRKWMPRLYGDINGEMDRILNGCASRVIMTARRYEHTLGEIEERTAKSREAVRQALERMGYKW
ncbi:MAG: SAM-dependent DNA methyltransferase [Oscillibacter sp.]|nr:SAM-dependent DNA methyltransferase [Oscillibacter sp.]